jgi:cation:H+ antiporter
MLAASAVWRGRQTVNRALGETIGVGTRPKAGQGADVIGRIAQPGSKMATTLLLFLGSAVLIYLSCQFFVNGVEWVGARLNIGQTATGTILAAFGTALPESAVTFVAVVFGNSNAEHEIGIGAALGGPLVLSTLAYGVVGLTLLGSARLHVRKKETLDVDCRRLSRDQGWFLSIFVVKLALGLVAFPGKPWLSILFLGAYALYVWQELGRDEAASGGMELDPLKICPRQPEPSLLLASLQTGLALAVIFAASRVFVGQLEIVGIHLGRPRNSRRCCLARSRPKCRRP